MQTVKFVDAIRDAMREEMYADKDVVLLGEAIAGGQGGAFAVTKGMEEEFGKDRVVDTPLSEAALGGIAVGAAVYGMKPIVEIFFGNLMTLVADEVRNQAGTLYYVSGGKINVPMVIRTCNWMRIVSGPHHCGNLDAMLMNSPGIKVVSPSNAYDAKGLMKAAIRDPNPVIYLEYSPLYTTSCEVPEEDYVVEIGKADIKRPGKDITVITYGVTVGDALWAAKELEKEGIELEVIDLRTILPYDKETIRASVAKTSRAIVAYEGYKTAGVGAEIAAFLAEECIEDLSAPVVRIACKDVPNPSNAVLIEGIAIDKKEIVEAARRIME